MSLSPAPQNSSDNLPTLRQPNLGTTTLFASNNLSDSAPKLSRTSSQERQSSSTPSVQGDGTSPTRMIVTVTNTQQFRDAGHRPSQSVPPVSPSSPSFRHSASSSVAQFPLTPDSSPRYRPKYGKRQSESSHKVTSPLIPKDENEPPNSPSEPTYKYTVTFPLRKSEEREFWEEASTSTQPSTFPLSSPPSSPPLTKRKMRPSIEDVFGTPSPNPRNSGSLSPPDTEQRERPTSKVTRDRERIVPRGENPFIFGKSIPRRTVKSGPELTSLDTGVALQAPMVNVTSPTPGASPSKAAGPSLSGPPIPSALKPPGSDHGHGPIKTVTYEDEVSSGNDLDRTTSREYYADDEAKLDTFSSGGMVVVVSSALF